MVDWLPIAGVMAGAGSALGAVMAWRTARKAHQTQKAVLKAALPSLFVSEISFVGPHVNRLTCRVSNDGGALTGLQAVYLAVPEYHGPVELKLLGRGMYVQAGLSREINAELRNPPLAVIQALTKSSPVLVWVYANPVKGYSKPSTTWLDQGMEVHMDGEHEARREVFEEHMNRYLPRLRARRS